MDIAKIRNIGIAAHIDAGKTTTTEGILHRAGRKHREGSVDGGNTTTDSDPTERQRGITIYSAAVSIEWRDCTINLIDTPGHVDFTAEVERALRVLDGAVTVLDAKEGVEAQSETVWRQADKHRIPRLCFVNKMDKLGADFESAVQSLRDRLSATPAVLHLPVGSEASFSGFVDIVRMRLVRYAADGSFSESDVPPDMAPDAARARSRLIELVSDGDYGIMERYLEGDEVTSESLTAAIRRQTLSGRLHPVLCGSAIRRVGIQHLLDAVCDLLPCPADTATSEFDREFVAESFGGGEPEISRSPFPDPAADLVALAFKVVPEATGTLTYIRIYSGSLRAGTRIFNNTRGLKENATRLFRMHADKREMIQQADAGDIVAVIGFKKTVTGDTLAPKGSNIVLESISFPDPVVSMSIEPRSAADRDRLIEALSDMRLQDPTFHYRHDAETGETIASGMGELHMEIVLERLRKRVGCAVGKPKVAYRETVTAKSGPVEHRHIKQTGGRGQRAIVVLRVEPLDGDGHFLFADEIKGGAVRRQYVLAVEKACLESMRSGGPAGGHPMTGVKATLMDGEEHEVDSSDMAFGIAAREAFKKAVAKARPRILEPIMRLSVSVAEEYFGRVSADLSSRGGVIMGSESVGGRRLVAADVPLARMFGYASDVRSLTGGRVGWSMEPERYELAPLPPS